MVIINNSLPVASRLFAPVTSLLEKCSSTRHCPALADEQWMTVGVSRCLMAQSSGRGFLQTFSALTPELCPTHSLFFESLKSQRRLELVTELNEQIVALGKRTLPDQLACFPCINDYEVYASDGHFHEHACHDPRRGEDHKHYAVGHLYSRNLRTGLVSYLAMTDEVTRKKEHEMRALKRLSIDALRHGAPQGRKVIHVYDRAAIDFRQWFKWKHGSGIYFISRTKENMALEPCGQLLFDRQCGINAGVMTDELVGSFSGVLLRRITFSDLHSGRTFEYLTNLTNSDIAPGVIAQLYKMRWDLEKSFDEIKNKLGECKAWASSATAKQMQAQFICMTLNLTSLLAHTLQVEENISNLAELNRKESRSRKDQAKEKEANLPAPTAWSLVPRLTQHSVKLYRWIATHLFLPTLWKQACSALRILYAAL